jgi:Beta-lactamase
MCAYARIVLARGAGLLDDAAFDRWIGPYADTGERGTRYGYGWDVVDGDGGRLIRHTGGTVGFTALLAIAPEDGLAVAICLNGYGVREALGSFALATVAAAVRGDPLPDVVPADPPDHVPDAGAVAGRFIAADRALDLEAADGGLLLRSGPVAIRLERWPDEPDTFAVPHPAFDRYLLRLIRDERGRAIGLTHGPARYDREGERPHGDAGATATPFGGLYRADGPWTRAIRVYEREGRLFAVWPSDGEEHELRPLADDWFAVGDPALPRRCRFDDLVDGLTQTLEYDGASLSRSFDG